MEKGKALIVVDVQNDFCPGGALGISGADSIMPVINSYIRLFQEKGLPVFLTRDWHSVHTSHFKKFGGVWPEHCVQGTRGAEFHRDLKFPKNAAIVSKGMDPSKDSYSAFQAEDEEGALLPDLLERMGVGEIYIAGLATDYCVKETTLDAARSGFKVNVLIDAVKGVDLAPCDSEKALTVMREAGAVTLTINALNLDQG